MSQQGCKWEAGKGQACSQGSRWLRNCTHLFIFEASCVYFYRHSWTCWSSLHESQEKDPFKAKACLLKETAVNYVGRKKLTLVVLGVQPGAPRGRMRRNALPPCHRHICPCLTHRSYIVFQRSVSVCLDPTLGRLQPWRLQCRPLETLVSWTPYCFCLTDFLPSLKTLIRNPVYILYLCASTVQFNSLFGMVTYKPKYIEQQYGQSSSKTNFVIGMPTCLLCVPIETIFHDPSNS